MSFRDGSCRRMNASLPSSVAPVSLNQGKAAELIVDLDEGR
jgi:hypothetical protein